MCNMFHTSNNIAWKILFYSNCELPVYKDQFIVLLHSYLLCLYHIVMDCFLGSASSKELTCQCR